MKIYIGSDHAGIALKERIKKYLKRKEISFIDLGGHDRKSRDDYPDYAFAVAEAVAKSKKKDNAMGILICGTGTGMVIAANKVKGIRACVGYDKYSAEMAVKDNDCNVICLRSRKYERGLNLRIIGTWLEARHSNSERHERRIKKIEKYERKRK